MTLVSGLNGEFSGMRFLAAQGQDASFDPALMQPLPRRAAPGGHGRPVAPSVRGAGQFEVGFDFAERAIGA